MRKKKEFFKKKMKTSQKFKLKTFQNESIGIVVEIVFTSFLYKNQM